MRTTKLAILALISFIPLLLSGCGSSRDSGGDQTVGLTPTATIAAASFVGSTQCLSCHSNKSNWGHTLHKAVLRAPNAFSPAQAATETFYAGTVNKGIKLSLGTAGGGIDNDVTPDLTPDGEFVAYYYSTLDNKWKTHYELGQGAAANTGALTTPSGNYALKYSAQIVKSGTEYFVQFTNLAGAGTAQYKILFSYGGEKNYKQRYVLADDNNNTGKLLGASKHISPLQYNDKWSGYVDPTSTATPDLNYKWVNYHGERWYNLTDSALTSPGSKDSFDGNCAGCHFTGYQIALNGAGEEIADAVETSMVRSTSTATAPWMKSILAAKPATVLVVPTPRPRTQLTSSTQPIWLPLRPTWSVASVISAASQLTPLPNSLKQPALHRRKRHSQPNWTPTAS